MLADTEPLLVQAFERVAERDTIGDRLVEQGAGLRALERDRRALRVVLVVGPDELLPR